MSNTFFQGGAKKFLGMLFPLVVTGLAVTVVPRPTFTKRTCDRHGSLEWILLQLSVGFALKVRFTTYGMRAKSSTQISVVRTSNNRVISIVACCRSVKLCTHAARAFQPQHKKYRLLPCLSHDQYRDP